MGWFKDVVKAFNPLSFLGDAASNVLQQSQNYLYTRKMADYNDKIWRSQHDLLRSEQLADYDKELADSRQFTQDQIGLTKQGFVDAGLSPASMGGNFSAVQSPTMATISPQGGTGTNPQMSQAMLFSQNQLIQAQIENLKAGARKNMSESDKIQAELDEYKNHLKYLIRSQMAANLQMTDEEYNIKKQQGALNEKEGQRLDNLNKMLKKQIDEISLKVDMLTIDKKYYDYFKKLDAAEQTKRVEQLQAAIQKIDSETALNNVVRLFKENGIGVSSLSEEFVKACSLATEIKGKKGIDAIWSTTRDALTGILAKFLGNVKIGL